ncbi:minor capsid protein [Clostridium butyricum]|uniref:Minor capsid n=1 Tax=Clostridium butyricum E4 str. BoNT E BL5262 TaxID=632245 RepID=C4IFE8_CLOBU|nr:minor capsid protein [Clostridium butyricum]EDT74949.1 hypothetical protein CBY_1158 [Clostridium butyricum 5521]EEP53325.1 hypothetical protein CLP_1652 [Clostridium butyricum E4 str. BoNT E BL5262]NFL32864.1 hypothetical protein [Clostridium butyricum]NFS20238.1 hypothetical protein [Clostridium butyricum]
MGFIVRINDAATMALRRKIQKDGPTQQFMTNEVARLSDDYIPMRSGDLKNVKIISQHQIKYTQPYARRQYYENKGATGGHRGKQWDRRMISDRGTELVRSVAAFCGGRSNT